MVQITRGREEDRGRRGRREGRGKEKKGTEKDYVRTT